MADKDLSIAKGEDYIPHDGLPVIEAFKKQVANQPEKISLKDKSVALTWSELDYWTDKIAFKLSSLGVKKGDNVGLLVQRDVNIAIGIISILKLGAVYVSMDPNYPKDRLEYIAQDCEMSAVLCIENLKGIFNLDCPEVCIDNFDKSPTHKQFEFVKSSYTDLLCLLYTSGSTGKPKGVELEHNSLIYSNGGYLRLEDASTDDNYATYVWHTFVVHINDIAPWIFQGVTLNYVPDSVRLNPELMTKWLDKEKITRAFFPTSFSHIFSQTQNPKTLKSLTMAGEKYHPISNRVSNFDLYNVYGATELGGGCCIEVIKNPEFDQAIGKPQGNFIYYIVDKDLKLVQKGERGEVLVAGPGVGRGYRNLPEKTKEQFFNNPFTDNPKYKKIFRTYDLGVMDSEGKITVYGRNDFVVKIRGFRVDMQEIDSILLTIDEIDEAVTIAKTLDNGEKFLASYYSTNSIIDIETVKEKLSQNVPDYMIPFDFIELDQLPKNDRGKIDRKNLPSSTAVFIEPSTQIEKNVVKVISQKLGLDKLSITANLKVFGLHSLSAVDIKNALETNYNYPIPLIQIINLGTVEKISKFIEENLENRLTIERIENNYPLSNAHQRYLKDWINHPETTFKIPIVLKLNKSLDESKLKVSVKTAIENHPILFSSIKSSPTTIDFSNKNSQLLAVDNGEFYWHREESEIEIVDKVINTDSEVFEIVFKEMDKGFNMYKPGSIRAFFSKTDNFYYFILIIDHGVFDGISQGNLIDEISALYDGRKIQADNYAGFEIGQYENAYRKLAIFNDAKKYFENEFSNFKEFTKLKGQKNIPLSECQSAYDYFEYDKSEIDKIANDNQVTVNNLFSAAFSYALTKQVEGNKLYFSTQSGGRNVPSWKNSIGLFVVDHCLALDTKIQNPIKYLHYVRDKIQNTLKYEFWTLQDSMRNFGFNHSTVNFLFEGGGFFSSTFEIGETLGQETLNDLVISTFKNSTNPSVPYHEIDAKVFELEDKYFYGVIYANEIFEKAQIKNVTKDMVQFIKAVKENK
jgi:amino acid adenylation domain-containing protein